MFAGIRVGANYAWADANCAPYGHEFNVMLDGVAYAAGGREIFGYDYMMFIRAF